MDSKVVFDAERRGEPRQGWRRSLPGFAWTGAALSAAGLIGLALVIHHVEKPSPN